MAPVAEGAQLGGAGERGLSRADADDGEGGIGHACQAPSGWRNRARASAGPSGFGLVQVVASVTNLRLSPT